MSTLSHTLAGMVAGVVLAWAVLIIVPGIVPQAALVRAAASRTCPRRLPR